MVSFAPCRSTLTRQRANISFLHSKRVLGIPDNPQALHGRCRWECPPENSRPQSRPGCRQSLCKVRQGRAPCLRPACVFPGGPQRLRPREMLGLGLLRARALAPGTRRSLTAPTCTFNRVGKPRSQELRSSSSPRLRPSAAGKAPRVRGAGLGRES